MIAADYDISLPTSVVIAVPVVILTVTVVVIFLLTRNKR
jgi:hypothetical protein